MPYKRSAPLDYWLTDRRRAINALAAGHAHVGGISGSPGRPLDESKPLAHAYLMVAVGQFQGFSRDLHDLAVNVLVNASGAKSGFGPILVGGMTAGRGIDRGNATNSTIKTDFNNIGVSPFDLSTYDRHWATDKGAFDSLIRLRNILAHGNQKELRDLLLAGTVRDTVTWARGQMPMLNRYARAMDKRVWHHLVATIGKEPW